MVAKEKICASIVRGVDVDVDGMGLGCPTASNETGHHAVSRDITYLSVNVHTHTHTHISETGDLSIWTS